MADIVIVNDALDDFLDNWLTANNPVKLVLTNNSTYTSASSLLDVLQEEINEEYGYSRSTVTFGNGVWNSGQSRNEKPQMTIPITASGGALQFDRVYFLGTGLSYANREVTVIDATNNRLEFAEAHPFQVGDKVTVTPDATGVVPSELLSSGNPTTLYVESINNSGTFWITLSATDGGSAINFSAGTLPIRVRSIDGNPGFYVNLGTTTVPNLQTYNFLINLRSGNSGVNLTSA